MAISLKKGKCITLDKANGQTARELFFGVNWGALKQKGLFRTKTEAIDIDASIAVYSKSGVLLDAVFFNKLESDCRGIKHSGDDKSGDLNGDDGIDNEVISIDFEKLTPKAEYLGFFLNAYRGHDFGQIPFASIQLYASDPVKGKKVLAKFDIENDAKFSGSVSMILGMTSKKNSKWEFSPIGNLTDDTTLEKTIQSFRTNHINHPPIF